MRYVLLAGFLAVCASAATADQVMGPSVGSGPAATTQPAPASPAPTNPVPAQTAKKPPSRFACAAICEKSTQGQLSGDEKILFDQCAAALHCISGRRPPLVYRPPTLDLPGQFRDWIMTPPQDSRV